MNYITVDKKKFLDSLFKQDFDSLLETRIENMLAQAIVEPQHIDPKIYEKPTTSEDCKCLEILDVKNHLQDCPKHEDRVYCNHTKTCGFYGTEEEVRTHLTKPKAKECEHPNWYIHQLTQKKKCTDCEEIFGKEQKAIYVDKESKAKELPEKLNNDPEVVSTYSQLDIVDKIVEIIEYLEGR